MILCNSEFCQFVLIWNIVFIEYGNILKSSIQFSHSVMSDSLRPHESQHARPHHLSCPSLTPRVHSNSCPLSRWYHPAISSSVVPFFSCSQSLPASESFPMSQLFAHPILCDPIDYHLPGPSVHGILQARILEWVVISFSFLALYFL